MLNERVISPPKVDSMCCAVDGLDAVVAIPVCNERQRIATCLDALAAQTGLKPYCFGILLFLNNCVDGTAEIVSAMIPDMPWPVRVIDVATTHATAGWARRSAMDAAAEWLRDSGAQDGVLLTTDADSRVGSDWVRRNLDHIAAGADGVAGRITLDADDAALLPARLHARGALEGAYEALLTEIGARLDPEPANPWPCHWTKSGATLAARRLAYEAIDGMPALPHGEDRAFVDTLRAGGFAVRHAVDIAVVTSGRLEGRAAGGAADTMRLRCEVPDSLCDDRLEPAARSIARILLRRYLRVLHGRDWLAHTTLWAPLLGLGRVEAARLAATAGFIRAHAAIEAASRRLSYRPVAPAQLPWQIRLASLCLKALQARDRRRAGRRDDRRPFANGHRAGQTAPKLP